MAHPQQAHSEELATLLALREQGSFVGAGRALQRHATVLSKRLASLEARLGVRLVERTTRQLCFTEEGARLVEKIRHAVDLIAEAEKEAASGAVEVKGLLRIALPAAMGRRWLSPMVAAFARANPQVQLEVEYSERFVDIVAERFDAAIRIGELQDSRLVATRLCAHRRILCAAPAYLEQHEVPLEPADLSAHNCLGFTGLRSFPEWRLTHQHTQVAVQVRGNLVSNDNESLLEAARQGLGIFAAGDWLVQPDLATGALEQVLPQWQLDAESGVYFVRPSAKFSTAAMVAFKQWITTQFQSGAPWQRAGG